MNCILLNSGHILEIVLYVFSLTSNKLSAVDFKAFIVLHAAFSCGGVCVSQFLVFLALMCMCTLHYTSTLEFMLIMLCSWSQVLHSISSFQ